MMPVRKADKKSGIRLSSPEVHKAMMPDRVISAATSSSETPMYQVIIFQFTTLLLISGAKLFLIISFINTKIFIFALIISINSL